MAQSDTSPRLTRAPKYFSSIRTGDKPRGLLKTTALAIEVPETQTPKHTVALHKSYTKGRAAPPGLSAYTTHFPMLTPKTKSPYTPSTHRTPTNVFSFSVTNRQRPLGGSPRGILSTQSSPNRSILTAKAQSSEQQGADRFHPAAKAVTPKSQKPVAVLLEPAKSILHEAVTQVPTHSAPPETASNVDQYQEHLFQTFQALRIIRTFPEVAEEELATHMVDLPRRKGWEGRKTIVFDLDETLVHCCDEESFSPPDVHLPIVFPTGEQVLVSSTQAGINIRPYVRECLTAANDDFEVVVFTASHQCYADVVLDYLDPERKLIHHRLYRDDCLVMQGLYIKDLRIFRNRDLHNLVIVDNAAYSFAYQLDNGIPIITWSDDRQDKELLNLIEYMKILAAADDIRTVNRETFRLSGFYEEYMKVVQSRMRLKNTKSKRRKRS